MSTPPPLAIVVKLFTDLNAQQVRYCHWKSSYHLDRSMAGLTDLDLLVDPAHAARFRLIVHQHNIRPILSSPDKQYPAVEDYLGFDPDTGRLIHLHVHYQLVLGEQFVKNYRLPLEPAFLEQTRLYQGLVKIPAPELELIVLAVRMLLKYRDRDVIKDVLSIRTPGLDPAMTAEFKDLVGQVEREQVADALKSHASFISPHIVLEFMDVVRRTSRAGRVLYRLRQNLRRDLTAYQRYSRPQAIARYFGALVKQKLPFLAGRSTKKTPATGGMTIALVGADGAGKSTVVNELGRWLSWKLEVHNYYMGSQEPSLVTRLIYTGYRATRKVCLMWSAAVGAERATSKWLDGLQRFVHNVYHLSTGLDRYRRYLAGQRRAAQGAIVIYDRYSLATVHQAMAERPMDGPRISAEASEKQGRLTRALSELEQGIYRRIAPPDHTLVLLVSPDVSQQRKPDHDRDMIEAKSHALQVVVSRESHAVQIDADQPLEQVLRQVKATVWQWI